MIVVDRVWLGPATKFAAWENNMDRNEKFNQRFNDILEYMNSELSFSSEIDDVVLDRIKNMVNRYNTIKETEKPFEEYKKAIFDYYANRKNIRVVVAEKAVKMLSDAIEEYHQTPVEIFHDS